MKDQKQKATPKKKTIKLELQNLEGFEHSELSRLCIGPNDTLVTFKLK